MVVPQKRNNRTYHWEELWIEKLNGKGEGSDLIDDGKTVRW